MNNRFIVQIIDHNTGERSPDFTCTYDELKETLIELSGTIDQEDYVLLVGIIPEDTNESPSIPRTPLVSIQTLLESWDWERSAEYAEEQAEMDLRGDEDDDQTTTGTTH